MKLIELLTLILFPCLFLGCSHTQSSSPPELNKVTRIEVRLPGKIAIKDDDLYKTITSPEEISRIVGYVKTHIFSQPEWKSQWCEVFYAGDMNGFFLLNFFEGEEHSGLLGVGSYKEGKFFLKYLNMGYRKFSCISRQEEIEFLSFAGLSEKEYKDLQDRLHEPKGWKE